jgi:hypothetical protein
MEEEKAKLMTGEALDHFGDEGTKLNLRSVSF